MTKQADNNAGGMEGALIFKELEACLHSPLQVSFFMWKKTIKTNYCTHFISIQFHACMFLLYVFHVLLQFGSLMAIKRE